MRHPEYTDAKDLGKLLDLSFQQIYRLAQKGVLTKGEYGMFHIADSTTAYCEFLHERAPGKNKKASL